MITLDRSFTGVYRGIVVSTADPEKRGRIQAKVAGVAGDVALPWATASWRGPSPLLKIGDGVWIMFEEGDKNRPVWIGSWGVQLSDESDPSPPDDPVEGISYRHIQSTPSATWTINHGLGYRPGGITVISSAGDVVIGRIVSTTTAQLVLEFSAAFAGEAHLS